MTDDADPAPFDDVNEAVGEEWEAETTPYERVREVVSYTYAPASAESVAEDARTSPKTARKHLEALADEGFVSTATGENAGTTYRRSKESLVVEQAADILANVSVDELVQRVSELRERVSEFQTEYGVDSPEQLTVDATNRTLSETAADAPDGPDAAAGPDAPAGPEAHDIDREAFREWQTTRRNLAFANAALSIANAERFVDGESGSTDGSVAVR